MRLVVMGQQGFGKACLEAILEKGKDEVVGVYCAPDLKEKPIDPIKEAAIENSLPFYQPANFKTEETVSQLLELKPDLCVMAYVTIFVPEKVRRIPRYGSICFHPSLLPKHRGPSSINWPIILGAKKTGLSIFWPNDGLDEGEILLQKEVVIEPDDTLGDIYFGKIFPLGVEAILESIELISHGNANKTPQDHAQATYESWCRHEDAEINWSEPTEKIYNLIRGTNPQPGAWTTLDGAQLKIFDCALTKKCKGNPGEIVQIRSEGFVVSTFGEGILVKRVKPENEKKISAGEFAKRVNLKPGTSFR
ncbi:MAG: Methionyl-tRNA formyltransferase [Alphaproteobacteria bacterium MarineAlpha3_Bin5]|nr:MAG: Methionyl-tRNA formyltransferase [Alphaproteobacteria bacterium MarineAlpha3_Bin5]